MEKTILASTYFLLFNKKKIVSCSSEVCFVMQNYIWRGFIKKNTLGRTMAFFKVITGNLFPGEAPKPNFCQMYTMHSISFQVDSGKLFPINFEF